MSVIHKITNMKKIYYTLLFSLAFLLAGNQVQAQSRGYRDIHSKQNWRESFIYYPQSNVYYSVRTRQYIYPMRGSWMIANRLPNFIRIGRQPGVVIERNSFDVWRDNRLHVMNYRQQQRVPGPVVYVPSRTGGFR